MPSNQMDLMRTYVLDIACIFVCAGRNFECNNIDNVMRYAWNTMKITLNQMNKFIYLYHELKRLALVEMSFVVEESLC